MRIIQLVPDIYFGDAVGNDTLALKHLISESGYETEIYAERIDSRLPKGSAFFFDKLSRVNQDDIIISHVSTASPLNHWIKEQACKKVMIYHNITPPCFFKNYSSGHVAACGIGYDEVRNLRETFDMVLADSAYNRQNLIDMGYACPINVLPILIPFDDYKKAPSEQILSKYKGDGFTNIIFVGRIAPNKCQQDVIAAFYEYQRYYNKKSRLFIVGNPIGLESYDARLKKYVDELGVENVIFTGHIKFDEILAYYHLSDLFLCQSEHEGFCVPLVEAMFFNKPIVAYDSSAIGWTLGGSGFLMKEKNSLETAAAMNRILTDAGLKETIIANQRERLEDFQYDKVKALFWKYMDEFIGNAK